MSLRKKLLLVGLIILILPLAGWEIVRETERFLRIGQEQSAQSATTSIAAALGVLRDWSVESDGLYVRTIQTPITLDGYPVEWNVEQAMNMGGASVLAVRDARYLYLLILVNDDHIVYSARPGDTDADHIVIRTEALQAPVDVTTTAPGWISVVLPEGNLRGEWQESSTGYTVELRLPLAVVGERLGLAVNDVDRRGRTVMISGTGPADDPSATLPIVASDAAISEALAAMAPASARVWLVNAKGWVMARSDRRDPGPMIQSAAQNRARNMAQATTRDRWLRTMIYRNLLASPMDPGQRRDVDTIRLSGSEVDAALSGDNIVRWEASPEGDTVFTIAAGPVRVNGEIVGAVVLEQSGDALLVLANAAVMRLLGLTLAAMAIAGFVLFSYATVLVFRIRRLHQAVVGAVTEDGHPAAGFPSSSSRDELGSLHRAFGSMLDRLRQYTGYLETLTQKLAHELRTPLAVVRTSLDNLEAGRLDAEQQGYAQRAREGTERLGRMIQSMTEASRLEQIIEQATPETFSLRAVVEGCLQGYRDVYPDRAFEARLTDSPCEMKGVPELLAQMLDKLVDNAVDFSPHGGWIRITLTQARADRARDGPRDDDVYVLGVANEGPNLPAGIRANLFDSLVSLRGGKKAEEPHLGLGLYIVRLIAQGHGGSVSATDLVDGPTDGVEFQVRFRTTNGKRT
ncbi:MAG: hypothetical protein E2O56_05055 [Gammaproteobacteria bacterium]|nr:MAG: hypothetical protein E2O56_05055 [Gammaproteobacteria bacterium]